MIGLTQLLNRLTTRGAKRTTSRILSLDPNQGPIYAVGDVHGCKRLLLGLLTLIQQDAAAFSGQPTIVPLGDLIDRGPDSAGVLDTLTHPRNTKTIKPILGNHERMMLTFFADPQRNLGWLDLGGFETLRSYGLALTAKEAEDIPQRRLTQILAAHVPQAHLDWLAALPHGYRLHLDAEDVLLVHAGFDPSAADTAQQEDVLIWGRRVAPKVDVAAAKLRRIQGHVIVAEPDPTARCIQIDTGAWQSGKLSALRLVSGFAPKLMCYSAKQF